MVVSREIKRELFKKIQTMRLIDADALYETIEKGIHENPHDDPKVRACHAHEHRHFLVEIARQPTVDAELVKHGRWIERTEPISWCEDDVDVFYECSLCNCVEPGKSNYCPNCGAKMDEGVR